MNLTKIRLDDSKLYVTSKSFQFELDDEKQRQFGVVFETTNMYEATGDKEFKDYSFLVQIGIIADKPHKSFDESGGNPCQISLLGDCLGYMGSISVDHVLVNGTKSNAEKGENGFEAMASNFSVNEATVKTYKNMNEQDKPYLSFKTEEAAQKFIDLVILHRLSVLGLIGFILDQPVNRAGETGWKQIETMVRGCKYSRKLYSVNKYNRKLQNNKGTE